VQANVMKVLGSDVPHIAEGPGDRKLRSHFMGTYTVVPDRS